MRLPPRTGLALATMMMAACFSAASPAHASVTVNCSGLQAALDAGDPVIVLNGMCNVATPYTFAREITLSGDLTDGVLDGFDGTATPGRALTGTNVGASVISDLTFQETTVSGADGSALAITGDSTPTIVRNGFYETTATGAGSRGGALFIDANPANPGEVVVSDNTFGGISDPNAAGGDGGAAFVSAGQANLTVSGNVVRSNTSGGSGGGLFLQTGGNLTLASNTIELNVAAADGGGAYIKPGGAATITNNVFVGNSTQPATGTSRGGGLFVDGGGSLDQANNGFHANSIGSNATLAAGGAEAVLAGVNFTSRSDRWLNSTATSSAADGGGFWLKVLSGPIVVHLENAAAAGNVLGPTGEGGGIYLDSSACPVPADCARLELVNATLAGNQIGAGGSGSGLDGSGSLIVQNSIIKQNAGARDLDRTLFSPISAVFSNVCDPTSLSPIAVFPGEGNICKNPLLQTPDPGSGNVTQTPLSPTLDHGSNALVPPTLDKDFLGEPRIADSDADRTVVVDMGADEGPHAILPPAPPSGPAFDGSGGGSGDSGGVAGEGDGGAAAGKPSVKLLAPRVASSKSQSNRFAVRFRPQTGVAVDHYELQVRQFPSKRYRTVSSNIRKKVHLFKGKYGRTYRFRGRAVNSAGKGAYGRATTVVPLDDRGTRRIKRKGSWQRPRDGKAFGKRLSRASKKGATITLRFRGKRVYIVARTSRRGGRMLVTLDKRRRQINLRSSKTRNRRIVLTRKTSTRGSHLLRLQVLRGRVEIDAIGILDRR